jgi:hypothetical protein
MQPSCVPSTVKVTAFDAPYCVVTTTGPVQLLVGAGREIDELPHEVVGSTTPFSVTLPGDARKFCPLMVICEPGDAVAGDRLVITGAGTFTVTVAEADLLASAWLAAVIVTLCSFVILVGAVYKP